MGRKALDREWARYTHPRFVLVGVVVEKFHFGILGNRLVDFLLPGDTLLPQGPMQALDVVGPKGIGFAGDLPFLPTLAERGVQLGTQRLKLCLECLPNDVDLGIVSDRLKRNMRRALVDETLADIALCRRFRLNLARRLLLLEPALRRVGEIVVRI